MDVRRDKLLQPPPDLPLGEESLNDLVKGNSSKKWVVYATLSCSRRLVMKRWLAMCFVLACLPVFAQVQEIQATVTASGCGTCFNVALLTLKQLPGVADASGDAREGWIKISVDPKKGVAIKDVIDRVRVAGFNKDARFMIKATGTLEGHGVRMTLVVPHQKEVFVINAGDHEKMAMNAASSRQRVWTSSSLSANGNQYDLTVEKLQKQ